MQKNIFIILLVYFIGFIVIHSLYSNNFYNYEFLYNLSLKSTFFSILIFYLLFVFGMVMLMPVAIFFLFMSGIIWGPIFGTIISTLATSSAASISFLIMRNFSSNKFLTKLKDRINSKLDLNIDAKNQIKYVILGTLNPFLPQSILNYSFGLTSIKFKDFFIIITFISLILNFFYVILGASLKIIIVEGNIKAGIIYFGVGITAITIVYFLKDLKLLKKFYE